MYRDITRDDDVRDVASAKEMMHDTNIEKVWIMTRRGTDETGITWFGLNWLRVDLVFECFEHLRFGLKKKAVYLSF